MALLWYVCTFTGRSVCGHGGSRVVCSIQRYDSLIQTIAFSLQFFHNFLGAAMSGQTIPDHQQRSAQVSHQVLEELDDLGCLDGSRKQSEVTGAPRLITRWYRFSPLSDGTWAT